MPVITNCSSCGSKLNVPDDLLGREVRCPGCGTVTVVTPLGEPQRSGAAAERPTEPYPNKGDAVASRPRPSVRRDDDFDDDRYSDRGPRRVRASAAAQENGAALGLGIASLVLGILAIPIAAVPCIGVWSLPVSGVGLVLGVIGLVIVLASKRGGLGFPIAGSSVNVVALGLVGLWFLVCAGMFSGMKQFGEELQQAGVELAKEMKEQQEREAAEWVDASQDAATHGDVRVRVKSVTLSPVDLVDGNGAKSPSNYLVIRLSIENTSAAVDVNYKGWSGNSGFGPDAATLKDKLFTTYLAATFHQKVKGQVRNSRPIAAGQSLEDVLVFQPPLNNPDELRLELPATTFGGMGKIKFRIPAAMIKR
jgi:hypothetical protein